jgi:hypothetical protein
MFYSSGTRDRIPNSLFSSQLSNILIKLEYYINLGWKCLQGTNSLVYRAQRKKCYEYDSWAQLQKLITTVIYELSL